jgi:hypothetical protein
MRITLLPALAARTLTSQSVLAADLPTVEKYEIAVPKISNIPAPGAAKAAFPDGFPMGVGSGMSFAERLPDGSLVFWVVGDRGPNADSPKYQAKEGEKAKSSKIFPAPDFVPQYGKVKVAGGKAEVIELHKILDATGKPISGRPWKKGAVGSTGEVPLDMAMKVLFLRCRGARTPRASTWTERTAPCGCATNTAVSDQHRTRPRAKSKRSTPRGRAFRPNWPPASPTGASRPGRDPGDKVVAAVQSS